MIHVAYRSSDFSISRYLFLRYVLVVLVLVSASGALFFQAGKNDLIDAAERYSVAIARNLNHEVYQHFFIPFDKTPDTYDLSDSTQFLILDQIARRFLAHLDVKKINFFNRQTVVIYSTNPKIIGQATPENLKLLRALEGELVSSLELAHEDPDIVYDTHPVDFLETYIPARKLGPDLKAEGEIVGSFEIYQDVSEMYRQISSLRSVIIFFSILIIAAHAGVVLFLTRRGDRLLIEERGYREELERSSRKKLEEMVRERTRELEEEKSKLEVILNSVPSALILLDRGLLIQSVSAAYEAITKNSGNDVRGRMCNLCLEFGIPRDRCPARRSLLTGRIESLVVPRASSGSSFEHTAVPIKRDGEVEAVLEIITDITERKRLQDQLVRAEKVSAVGEMAAVIAHEVRNSLTSVKLILQHFSESEKLKGRKDKESFRVAMNSMYRLEGIVNDLLNFAKPREMHFNVHDINRVVKESIIFSRHQFERRRISLVEEYSNDLPFLRVDDASLKEVVVNLLLNAAHAVPSDSGKITVKTVHTRLPENIRDSGGVSGSSVTLERGEEVVVVEVRDNGCGIAARYLERIFDPFFTTKMEGTGLGLTMAKRVVHEHGGVLLVETEEGFGSVFRIILPVKVNG